MGKTLVIKRANFKDVALNNKKYHYGIPDSQFENATGIWHLDKTGFSILNYEPIHGKNIDGIRINVASPGSVNIYKTDNLNSTSLTFLTTIATNVIGLQDIDFDSPIQINLGEYLVFSLYNDTQTTLKGKYTLKDNPTPQIIQEFNYNIGGGPENVGKNGVGESLNIDFYTKV